MERDHAGKVGWWCVLCPRWTSHNLERTMPTRSMDLSCPQAHRHEHQDAKSYLWCIEGKSVHCAHCGANKVDYEAPLELALQVRNAFDKCPHKKITTLTMGLIELNCWTCRI